MVVVCPVLVLRDLLLQCSTLMLFCWGSKSHMFLNCSFLLWKTGVLVHLASERLCVCARVCTCVCLHMHMQTYNLKTQKYYVDREGGNLAIIGTKWGTWRVYECLPNSHPCPFMLCVLSSFLGCLFLFRWYLNTCGVQHLCHGREASLNPAHVWVFASLLPLLWPLPWAFCPGMGLLGWISQGFTLYL